MSKPTTVSMQLISLQKIHSAQDLVRKARESYLIVKAMTLEPNSLNRRDNFCCDVLHLKNILSNSSIITSLTSVNLKKAGVASRNIVFKKAIHVAISALQ